MECEIKKFSSDTVCKECSDIYEKNLRKIKSEIGRTISKLNNFKSFKSNKISSFIAQFNIKEILAKFFEANPNSSIKELIAGLRKLQRDVELRCLQNISIIREVVSIHKRDKPYKEIYQLFQADGLTEIDFVDVEIILDAHHVGLEVNGLFLISGDYKHIISRKEMIIGNTSLENVIGLGEFNL
ncbi:MAG: hypothetical protein KAH86_01805 [Methanosarcinales archaeon]|nr:hypothetical protein [Methanosarcinales archaeon]